MQQTSVYLYRNTLVGYINADNPPMERFNKVYNRNLKIFRSVDNRIDIQVKNYDQKGTDISAYNVVFSLIDAETKKIVISKDCIVRDPLSGRIFVTLTQRDVELIDEGMYHYSVVAETRSDINETQYTVTSRTPLYIDSQYGTIGNITVSGDVIGSFTPSVIVDKFSYTNPSALGEPEEKFYISSIIDANPSISSPATVHTFQFYYSNDFVGDVVIQASLDDQGGTPSNWSDVVTVPAGVSLINVIGLYNWFRIRYEPTEGAIQKILYR